MSTLLNTNFYNTPHIAYEGKPSPRFGSRHEVSPPSILDLWLRPDAYGFVSVDDEHSLKILA